MAKCAIIGNARLILKALIAVSPRQEDQAKISSADVFPTITWHRLQGCRHGSAASASLGTGAAGGCETGPRVHHQAPEGAVDCSQEAQTGQETVCSDEISPRRLRINAISSLMQHSLFATLQARHANRFLLEVDGLAYSLCHEHEPFLEIMLSTILLDNIRHRDRSGGDDARYIRIL